jgi:hypothetical protein
MTSEAESVHLGASRLQELITLHVGCVCVGVASAFAMALSCEQPEANHMLTTNVA